MDTKSFEVSVVITAFKIGPVLSDTIHSVISQCDVNLGYIVIVVDGCGFTKTTRNTLSRFSRAHDDLVQFIWLENGGVSRARNIGAQWILENRPNTDGIYYIDGDDLLNPLAITKSVKALRHAQLQAPEKNIGWTYCNQKQFGDDTTTLEYPRSAIPNQWLANNMSQPSCLIDRKMFDAGVFWDEGMRKGIEDWEYWLSAIEAGFIGTNVRDVYLKYRRLTGNRSSLNRANDAITKDYMRQKHKALYTTDFFLDNEHTLFPRWAFSIHDSPMTFNVGTDMSLPMATRDHDYLRQSLSYRFSTAKIDLTIVDPYFPDMIAFVDPNDAHIINELKMTPSILREMESVVSEHGLCTFSIVDSLAQQNDTDSDSDTVSNSDSDRDVKDIHVSKKLTSLESMASRDYSSYFISIKKLFALLDIENTQLSDLQVLNALSECSSKHLEMTITGFPVPVRDNSLPGQSANERLNNLVLELHRIYRLPPALSLFNQDCHHLCGSHFASHEKLGTDILGVWPILPKLKGSKQQIGLLVTEESRNELDEIIQDISSVTTEHDFEINVLLLGNNATITDLIDNPLIASIGFMGRSLDMPILKEHNGYLGLPAYELLDEVTRQDIVGYMIGMDVVIDLCGPCAASVMTNLKSHRIHTSTYIKNVRTETVNTTHVGRESASQRDDSTQLSTDPVAIQAYCGAYGSLIVPNNKDAQKLTSYGVTPNAMVSSASNLLHKVFDQTIKEASRDSTDNISSNDTENERSLAA